MSKQLPDLSKAEWLLMKISWKKGQSTAREIYDVASKHREWEYQTVKTMLDRLAQKGYLRVGKVGPICLYDPAITRAKTVGKAIDAFLDTVLDNTFTPLFAHLAKGRKLGDEEIAFLRRLVKEQKEETDELAE